MGSADKATRQRKGMSSRRKGARAELVLFALLTEALQLPAPLRRNLSQSRDAGADAEDNGLAGWSIEVKNRAVLSRPSWWRQTCTQAKAANALPILFYRLPKRRGAPESSAWRAVLPVTQLTALESLDAVHDHLLEAVHGADVSFEAAVQVLRVPVQQ